VIPLSMSRVTPGRRAMGPERNAVFAEPAASSTAWDLAQWSRACWMRAVSRKAFPLARDSMEPLVAWAVVKAAFSVMQAGGKTGSVTLRVSCARREALEAIAAAMRINANPDGFILLHFGRRRLQPGLVRNREGPRSTEIILRGFAGGRIFQAQNRVRIAMQKI